MPIAEWTAQIPGDVDQEWQQRERAANRTDLNWVRYFFDYSQIPSEATNHFKEKFYCVQQREDQQKKGASFENIRKIAIYLLKLAPNAAIHSPGYNGQPGKPALLLGRATGNFQAPKFALVFNPSDIKDENFYASFQEGQGVTLNADAKSVSTNDKYKWKRLTNPIHLSANGDLIFKDDDQSLIHLKEFLENLNNYIIRNPHNEYNDTLRPDNLGSTSPVYPKLVGRKENNARSTPTTISSAPLPLPPNKMNINTILFGPPGTGKTYNTLVTALHALNYKNKKNERLVHSYNCLIKDKLDNLEKTEREDFKNDFENQIENGRIVFTTFHQSYAYEDFIEGVRVRTVDKQVCYEIHNGTFKQLARKALFYKAAQLKDEAIDDSFENTADFYARTLDADLKDWLNDLDQPREKYSEYAKHKDLIHKIIANDAEIQKFINKKSDDETPKFILIIDEINRGNISKILGELITLIEDSKRAGGSDRATVKLPSSRELFTVPDNLYIIGTMNTSDRSLATLDVALRRRFDFIEMMPQPDFLCGIEISGINLREWFFELNKNIQITRGREFTIGHAFFTSLKENEKPEIEDLANLMKRKILPLLDEYFFEDWEGIRRVLGDDKGNKSSKFINIEEHVDNKYYFWNFDALTKTEAYTKLYSKNIATDNQADAEP